MPQPSPSPNTTSLIEETISCTYTSPEVEIADSLVSTGTLEVCDQKLVEIIVKLLKDTGADWNLVSARFIASLGNLITLTPLSKPIRFDGVYGPGKQYVTHTCKLPIRLADDHFSEEVFAVAPLGISQDIILGQPWLWKYCPTAMTEIRNIGISPDTLRDLKTLDTQVTALYPKFQRKLTQDRARHSKTLAFGPSSNPHTAYQAGGDNPLLDSVNAEIFRRTQAEKKAMTCYNVSIAIEQRLEDLEATRSLVASATQEDPGVRGLTGNKEGWLNSIPEPFRRFAHTVFSDEAASELPPHRPEFDCVITIREGEKLKTSKIYDMSHEQLTTLKALMDAELKKGFIRVSNSQSSAPVFFVTDPPSESRNKGQLRLVVDYRDLNSKIKLDEYPIPLTRTIMSKLAKAKIATKFDVRSGFGNLRVAPGSEAATAFKTPFGLFEYQVMPMGLASAPSVFQRFINHVLNPYLDQFCFAYLDDIIIFSETPEEHLEHVNKVLTALESNSLHLKPSKCVWQAKELSFLGFTFEAGKGIRMSDDKVFKITSLKSPRDLPELREALGLIQFYGHFIPHFSDLASPLHALTAKEQKWLWTETCEKAFRKILAAVRTDVFLTWFDPKLPTTFETDASDEAFGGVISQPGPDGKFRPVIMFHQKFKSHEKNWDIHDKELYAIVYGFNHFRHFLAPAKTPVSVISDHRNLAKFMFTTDLLKSHDGRLGRWWQTLSQHKFVIEYRPGTENTVADFLSRYQQDALPAPGLTLLPAHRFSPKALGDIHGWFKKSRDHPNIRAALESTHFGKKIGSVLPVGQGSPPLVYAD